MENNNLPGTDRKSFEIKIKEKWFTNNDVFSVKDAEKWATEYLDKMKEQIKKQLEDQFKEELFLAL